MAVFWSVLLLLCLSSQSFAEERYPFPAKFAWGTAIAAYQVEGGNLFNDWYQWELMGKIKGPQVGLAANHYQLYAQDYQLAAAMKTNALRFSFEWSRIEPRKNHWDMEVVAHYRSMLKEMRSRGLVPYLTLLHGTLPAWLVDFKHPEAGHFMSATTVAEFREYVAFIAQQFGDLVDVYFTLNEPNLVALNGGLAGIWPPGSKASIGEMATFFARGLRGATLREMTSSGPAIQRFVRMFYYQLLAHVAAYDAVKANDTVDADGDGKATSVGLVYNIIPLANTKAPSSLVAFFNAFNYDLLNCLSSGKVRLFGNSGLSRKEVNLPVQQVRGKMDFLGINYYTSFSLNEIVPLMLSEIFKLPGRRSQEGTSDLFGFPIRPEAMYHLLKDLHKRFKWPLLITENGIATKDEALRSSFLIEHLKVVSRVIQEGVPVNGYFVWSLLDAAEWHQGYGYNFGLIDVNFKTLKRTMRSTALVYKAIIEAGEIPVELMPKAHLTILPETEPANEAFVLPHVLSASARAGAP